MTEHKPKKSFIRKVMNIGDTRALSLGRIIPKDWDMVTIQVNIVQPNYIYLMISKLEVGSINAHSRKGGKRR